MQRSLPVCWCGAFLHFSLSAFHSFPLFLPSLCPGLRFRLAHWCFRSFFFFFSFNCDDFFFPHIFPDSSNGTGKRQQNQISFASTPFSCYLNGALRGLAFWPRSLCCQHFGRFVCDFIRNQNNSQMKRKIVYAKCCCVAGAVCALNTLVLPLKST